MPIPLSVMLLPSPRLAGALVLGSFSRLLFLHWRSRVNPNGTVLAFRSVLPRHMAIYVATTGRALGQKGPVLAVDVLLHSAELEPE